MREGEIEHVIRLSGSAAVMTCPIVHSIEAHSQ